MMRIVAIMSTQNDGARVFGVAKFPMGTFATRHTNKTGGFQVRNQLSDFSRHAIA
jgi:hypothetical protein